MSESNNQNAVSEAMQPWSKSATGASRGEEIIFAPGVRTIDDALISPSVILSRSGPAGMSESALLAVEKYRLLCARVLQVARSLKSRVFLVTSSIAKEGKTLTSLNLAYGLSRVPGVNVLLAELDLRRPSMKQVLGPANFRKEMHFLESDNDWHQWIWQLRPNLHALLASESSLRSDVLLQSERMRSFLDTARAEYDYVILDSAPMLSAADSHALLPLIDQALFVVRANYTPIDRAREGGALLGNKLLGCVLNDVGDVSGEYYDPRYLMGGSV